MACETRPLRSLPVTGILARQKLEGLSVLGEVGEPDEVVAADR